MQSKLRKFLTFFFFLLICIHPILLEGNNDDDRWINEECKNLRIKPIHLSYYYRYSSSEVKNLTLIAKESLNGKLLEALRYENITQAVESRYCLPQNLILAMIVLETWGQDCLSNTTGNNSWGDGGFGLCHMQGIVAEEYGLSTVCNTYCGEKSSKYQCFRHAKELGVAMRYVDNCDIIKMIKRDDRLHPILNLDAVGRILSICKNCSIEEKVFFYRGGSYMIKLNYWNKVEEFRKQLNSNYRRKSIEEEFNQYNQSFSIDGQYFDNPYLAYIEYNHGKNMNYGLWEYISLGVCTNCCD